jgi:hypothetical protein
MAEVQRSVEDVPSGVGTPPHKRDAEMFKSMSFPPDANANANANANAKALGVAARRMHDWAAAVGSVSVYGHRSRGTPESSPLQLVGHSHPSPISFPRS